MNAFTRFATAMSDELFIMKAEDLPCNTLYLIEDHAQEFVPPEYVTGIIDDPAHISAIKERIRLSVLADVQANPDEYDMCGDDYVYSGNIYDHACLVDAYIEEQFLKDHPEFHTVFQCPECGSDNVQVKAWVRPNENAKLVDYLTDQITDGFCDDCHQHVMTETVEMNVRHKVIGYQVCNDNTDQPHPRMLNNKMVYNLLDADAMLRDLKTDGDWKLKTIWTADIMDPIKMFSGDPRNA